eukprot:9786005-Karenia_brevis.AAC.1
MVACVGSSQHKLDRILLVFVGKVAVHRTHHLTQSEGINKLGYHRPILSNQTGAQAPLIPPLGVNMGIWK